MKLAWALPDSAARSSAIRAEPISPRPRSTPARATPPPRRERNRRGANIAPPEEHARARHQPCYLRDIFRIGRSGASNGGDACLGGVRLALLILSILIELRRGRRSSRVALER